jgi:hypothetical protein
MSPELPKSERGKPRRASDQRITLATDQKPDAHEPTSRVTVAAIATDVLAGVAVIVYLAFPTSLERLQT